MTQEARENIALVERCHRNCIIYPSMCKKYSRCKVSIDQVDYEMADQILAVVAVKDITIEELIEVAEQAAEPIKAVIARVRRGPPMVLTDDSSEVEK